MNPRRLILLVAAATAALLVGAEPASATHTSDHAATEIAAIVAEGQADMNQVVSGLAGDISGLSEETAVVAAADEALASIKDIWTTARTAVDDVVVLYPGKLGQVGGDAKQQLQDARQTANNTVSDLVDAWTPPAPVTTTTTTTSTTTPAPAEAGPGNNPGNGPGNNPGNGPGSNSGNGPDSNSGSEPGPGSEPNSDTNGPDRSPYQPPSASGGPVEGPGPQDVAGSGIVLELAALTPVQPFTVSPEAITSLLASDDTGATATMAAMLDTVLSPAVVDLVLSPLLILEILLRTLVDGGLRFIGPLALFAVSAMALFAYDRFSKRHLILDAA